MVATLSIVARLESGRGPRGVANNRAGDIYDNHSLDDLVSV